MKTEKINHQPPTKSTHSLMWDYSQKWVGDQNKWAKMLTNPTHKKWLTNKQSVPQQTWDYYVSKHLHLYTK